MRIIIDDKPEYCFDLRKASDKYRFKTTLIDVLFRVVNKEISSFKVDARNINSKSADLTNEEIETVFLLCNPDDSTFVKFKELMYALSINKLKGAKL